MAQKWRRFCWIGGFFLLVELHQEGSAINRATPSSISSLSYLLSPPVVPGIWLNLHDTGVDKASQPNCCPDLALCPVAVRGEHVQLEARDCVAFLIAKLVDITESPEKRASANIMMIRKESKVDYWRDPLEPLCLHGLLEPGLVVLLPPPDRIHAHVQVGVTCNRDQSRNFNYTTIHYSRIVYYILSFQKRTALALCNQGKRCATCCCLEAGSLELLG